MDISRLIKTKALRLESNATQLTPNNPLELPNNNGPVSVKLYSTTWRGTNGPNLRDGPSLGFSVTIKCLLGVITAGNLRLEHEGA